MNELPSYLRSVLDKTGGMRLLLKAYKDGTLADEKAIEHEIIRIENEVKACLRMLVPDPAPASCRTPSVCLDDDPVLARFVNGCTTCSED